MILALGAIGFLMSSPGQTYGVSPFTDSLIAALGLTRVQLSLAYMIFLYASIVSIVLRPVVGWLCDRIPLKYLLMTQLAGICISALGLRVLHEGLPMWIVIVGNGLTGATLGTMASVTWPNFYGRSNLGAISGFNMAITVFASAIGPWLFSQCQAAPGSYSLAITGTAIAAAVCLLLAFRGDNPQETR